MADTKLKDLTSGAPAAATDIVYAVKDPTGTPSDAKLALSDVKTYMIGAGSVSIASGKTLTGSNTLTLVGTDGTTMTFPSTSATIARTDAGNTFTGNQVVSSGSFGLSGNISTTAWTTTGVRYKNVSATLTDTSSSGTVAAAYTDLFGGNTIAASNSTTFTDYFTMFVNGPTAGTNVTLTRSWALGLNGNLQIASASQIGWSTDLFLTRRAAANLRLGAADAAAPVAQTLSVQSVVAGTTNTAGANLTITGSQGTGTGAGGSIIFQVAPAGSSGTAQNALATALTINPTREALFAGNLSLNYGLGFQIYASGSTTNREFIVTNFGGNGTVNLGSNWNVSWGSSTTVTTSYDVALWRDAANTLALRNGTNAQRFNSYRTYTDGSNYARLSLAWSASSTALVMAEGAGTGSDGSVAFNDAALATNATVGFVMIPSCAGAPTGTPADIPTGQIPMVWDSTNLKLYVYTGGAWKASAAFT